ncbi:hypothetical protein Bca52824_044906 [Brassica carinata]|uniref:non-specific serine/threonine protein kinase n=1 Tax=Brassica carinata TaxID=52824 RepID=A0A8X7UNL1_BRACI|nr:hypothetical protein Bca52824_044906 [Brassica carinata]
MGNTCSGPNLNPNGFLQSVTLRAARTKAARRRALTEADNDASSALDPAPPAVQTPPVKMASKEAPNSDVKPKKEAHMKRMESAGLQIDSVLGRKTENLKEIYSVGRKLGQGQFGTTFLLRGQERKLTTPEDVEDVRREIQIMHHLSGHPNVIQIVGAYEDAVAVHVVMEICAEVTSHYTERKAAELARTIVGVIEACHSLGVMHRDLKTFDFGLSVFFKPGETFTDVVGSPYYVAPEVLNKNAGVIIYILLSGVPPFWDEMEQGIFEQVLKGGLDFVSEPWPSVSESAKDLVRRMLIRDPKKRMKHIDTYKYCNDNYVAGHPWARVDGVALDKPIDSAVLTRLTQFSAMNKLNKIAVKVIAESLSEEEIAGLKEMFKMIDADNSGHITPEELKKVSSTRLRLYDVQNYQIIWRIHFQADIDNSGTIDYGEFIAAMVQLNKIEKEDHIGYITRDELQQACRQFGLADVHLDDILSEVDKDNDGRIDYSEFVEMMQDTGFGKMGLVVS